MLQEGAWNIQLVFPVGYLGDWTTPKGILAPVQDLSPTILLVVKSARREQYSQSRSSFEAQPHMLSLNVAHHSSAFVDEVIAITATVKNNDARRMDVRLSVFLQPADEEDCKYQDFTGDTVADSSDSRRHIGRRPRIAQLNQRYRFRRPRVRIIRGQDHNTSRASSLHEDHRLLRPIYGSRSVIARPPH